MKIQDLKKGQILKNGTRECQVIRISLAQNRFGEDKFEVQYVSGVCWVYKQSDLDDNTITTYIG